jgi:hypothetical protein
MKHRLLFVLSFRTFGSTANCYQSKLLLNLFNPAVREVYTESENLFGLGMTPLPPSSSVTGPIPLLSAYCSEVGG